MGDYWNDSGWYEQQRESAARDQARRDQEMRESRERWDEQRREADARDARREQEMRDQRTRLGTGRPVPSSGGGVGRAGCGCVVVCVVVLFIVVYVIPHVFGGPPQLAASYRGTIHQTGGNQSAVFTLTSIQEGQQISVNNYGNLSGEATFSSNLVPSGPFSGQINGDKTMNFTIGNFVFTANVVNSVKSLSGTYTEQITNPQNHTVTAGVGGTWQLTATS